GIKTSRLLDRRAQGGTIADEKRMRSPPSAARSRTRGQRTATGPMPVTISRSGKCPWRTNRARPSAVSLSAWSPRKPAISASTACANSARAPLRKISVNGSLKVPGCASLITLSWVTAYHSFGGEVEAFEHPHDTPPYPFIPSPTFALSSQTQVENNNEKQQKRGVDGAGVRRGSTFSGHQGRAPSRQKSPRRSPTRASCAALLNTLFWKILVTRVKSFCGKQA